MRSIPRYCHAIIASNVVSTRSLCGRAVQQCSVDTMQTQIMSCILLHRRIVNPIRKTCSARKTFQTTTRLQTISIQS